MDSPHHSHRFRRLAFAVFLIATAVTVVLVRKSGADFGQGQWTFPCPPGPWGNLECTRIAVEMPEVFVSLTEVKNTRARWFFPDGNRPQILALFRSAGLSAKQADALEQKSRWETDPRGIWITPPDDLVLGLPQPVRQMIYATLARHPENSAQATPFAYRPELLPEIFQHSGLQPETIQKFKTLLYPHQKLMLFSDVDTFVNSLPSEREQVRFLKTISRTSTLLVKLKVDEHSDIDQLVEYWGAGRRKKDLRALLESMAAVPGGTKIDVAHLLPNFARQHIYTYPDPLNPLGTNQHCHWTSLNFFTDTPNAQFGDNAVVQKTMQADFTLVTEPPRMGDVFLFLDSGGNVIHSATYIANDIMFTKNGGAENRPWIYMQLADLRACYEHPGESLNLLVFRRKKD